ncbi:MAG: Tetratricopeptide 1 repeat-containing protein, partial [Candidatus Acidoferrum typicum]|nr:Tetratricopeptide 1 repeat-containing protein [Candidatus Acidoferrum typicum]
PQLKLGEQDQPDVWDVQLSCKLAVALLLQKDLTSAVQRIGPCLRSAKKFGNLDLLAIAHQTNVWILQAAGRQSEAQESIAFLTQHLPEDPMHFVELAQLRTQQGDELETIKAWRQALKLFEAKGDQNRTAWVHLAIGNFLSLAATKNDEEERHHLEAALSLYQRLDDVDGAGRTNTHLGRYFARKNDSVRALRFFDMALTLLRRAKNQSFEAYTLSEIGNTYRSTGDSAKALVFYRQAGELYHTLNDLADEAFQLRYQAWAFDDLHKPQDTFETTLKAKRVADSSGAWSPRYWIRRYFAVLYGRRGEYESSIVALREARAISIAADQPLAQAWADLALAAYLATVGEREEAVNALNQALPVFQQSKDIESEGDTYSELMGIYGARESELRDFDKALQYYQSARRLAETHDPARAVSLNLDAVEVYWQQKRYKEAAALGKEALDYYVSKKDDWGQASALLSLAEVQRSAEEIKAAAASLKRAEPLIKRIGDFYMTGRFYYGDANQKKKEGNLREAIKRYESVIGMLERFKSTANPVLRRNVSDTYGYIYDELIDAWYQLSAQEPQRKPGFADRALEQAELNKSRVFTTAWGRTFLDALRRRLPASLQEKERTLTASQDALQLEMEQSISGQGLRPVKQVQESLKRLDGELAALKKDLGQASPAYAEVRYPRAVAIADLPVRAGEAFIEFKMLEDSLLVWIITGQPAGPPELAAFYKVAHPRVWFQERVLGIRSAFNRGYPDQFDAKVSEELFNAIFPEPYTQHLTSAQSVIIVPDDILFLLPFELLSPQASRSQFILLMTPTSYFPSAGALRLSRAIVPTKREWPAQFFGLADPITTSDDERYGTASIISVVESLATQPAATNLSTSGALPPTSTGSPPVDAGQQLAVPGGSPIAKLKSRGYFFERLPETAKEVKNIAALFPATESNTVIRTGTEATKRELLQTDLDRFRFVHFATHGFLPVESGVREPALILSYDGMAEEKMMFTLSEVVQLRLHADMVVLSACNTGSGRVTRAEGVASLGMSFLAAGASSVTVSLWQVSDQSTAILMQEYYRNLLGGMPKNAALAAARAALVAKGYTNPYFWAPFVLTGE